MAQIIVKGSEATVTVTEIDPVEGVYGLECDKGAWCPRREELRDFRSTNLADVVLTADVHADCVDHL